MDEVLNAPETVALRRDLLDGTLDPLCRDCVRWPVVPVTEFRRAVEEFVDVARRRRLVTALPLRHRVLAVRALGRKGPTSQGAEVWITGLKTEDGSHLPLTEVSLDTTWMRRDGIPISTGVEPGIATWNGEIRGSLTLEILSHPWSGVVEVTCDGKSQVIDLWGPESATKTLTFE
jgi:hypothetical protein